MAVICVNMYIQIYAVPLLWLYIATTFSGLILFFWQFCVNFDL